MERGTRLELVSQTWKDWAQPIYQPRNLVVQGGIEPPASRLSGERSSHLSY